jgi:hypothetical protein
MNVLLPPFVKEGWGGFFEKKLFVPLYKKGGIVCPVMPDLIRHPVFTWIPAFAGMTHEDQ